MTDDRRTAGSRPGGPDDPTGLPADLGPVAEEPTSAGFFDAVHGKIERRGMVNQFLSVSWHVTSLLLLESIRFAFHLFEPATKSKGDEE